MELKYTKNVKAYVQILPRLNETWEDIKILDDKKTIYARARQDFGKGRNITNPNYWIFETDGILFNLNQNDIFELIAKETLKKSVMGNDTIIFSYGQTGSGKSATVNGLQNNYENRGLIPRILSELFELKELFNHNSDITYSVTYVEIARNYIFDLLNNNGNKILYNPYKDLKYEEIKSEDDGLKLLFKGECKRIIKNITHISNILTSVFTIHVSCISRVISNPIQRLSKIHIVDMAGNDVDGSSTCEGKNSREVGMGNLNKSQLELCLRSINGDIINQKVSIKDSGVLVSYLGRSLGPHSLVSFIGHIRTTREDLLVTISTLRLIHCARRIKSAKLKPMVKQTPELMVTKLEKELIDAKHEMYLNSMLMNEDLSYNISQARMQQMENAIEEFVNSKSNSVTLLNVTDTKIALNIFKEICTKLAEEIVDFRKPETSESKIIQKSPSYIKSSATSENPDEKSFKAIKSNRSRESQISHKKRKSNDKLSKYGKMNVVSKSKLNASGSLTKSGITIGQLLSYEYEGDVTKSLKLKTKSKSIDRIREEADKDRLVTKRLSEINLFSQLGDQFDATWVAYKDNKSYKYIELNNNLNEVQNLVEDLLREFNNNLNFLKEKLERIDIRKNELLRIKMYKDTNVERAEGEFSKLSEVEDDLALRILELITESVQLRETLLYLQSEIRINIDYYHRTKSNIIKDFTEFCVQICKMKMPLLDQTHDCIADILNTSEKISLDETESKESYQKNLFYKYQTEMKKKQTKKLEDKHAKIIKI